VSVIALDKKKSKRATVAGKSVSREAAMAIASGFIVRHLRDRCMAGLPSIVDWSGTRAWVAPILLTYPGKGILGEVGMIAVDATTGRVCAHTPRKELDASAAKLTQGRRNEIEAAFHRARKS
jgi:hypothetical protein